jgi:hypothetical protein
MRAAPPVQATILSHGAWRTGIAATWALAASACTAWALGKAGWAGGWPAALAVFAAVGLLARRRVATDAGVLAWDGDAWSFRGRPGEVDLMIDLGTWMLLRFAPARPGLRAWLAVSTTCAGPAWHGLRAAVYSRGPNKSAQ